MERCPNCRARPEGGDSCRRCGMGLSLLLATERAAERHTTRAAAALARGDVEGALDALHQAQSLTADPLVRHLIGFVAGHQAGS